MSKLFITSLTALLLLSSTTHATYVKNRCASKDADDIVATVKQYVDKTSAISSNDVSVINLHCVNSYAYAIVHPTKPTTDDATAYLKKEKKGWTVLQFGTSFEPSFLKTLPADLRHVQ